MQLPVIIPVLGLLLILFSASSIPPIIVALIYSEPEVNLFIYTFLITLTAGGVLRLPYRHVRVTMRNRDGFVVTVLLWVVLSLVGALPLLMMDNPALTFTDAFFESLSGLTTTGATILTGIDTLPRSILFYRQQLQWLGGMGIIVLAVAILPMLGIGGLQLYRAETPGPVKDSKLKPRMAETAKVLWTIYMGLTLACALAYWLAGMSFFDAISHSFSTVAIGGFSTHDASIGYYDSPTIHMVAALFMLLSGVNFALHFTAWRSRSPKYYLQDPEFQGYILIMGLIIAITVTTLYLSETYSLANAVQYGIFEVISVATTTGYATTGFSTWPTFLPFLLFLASFAGGCSGSTAGGMKVIRVLLVLKQGIREMRRLVHPNAIFVIKLGGKAVNQRISEAVWGFFSAYVILFIVMFLGLMATGLDLTTAFSTLASSMNNLGPALGEATTNYQSLPNAAKWILCFAMLLGRLEIFTLIILFTPTFWRY